MTLSSRLNQDRSSGWLQKPTANLELQFLLFLKGEAAPSLLPQVAAEAIVLGVDSSAVDELAGLSERDGQFVLIDAMNTVVESLGFTVPDDFEWSMLIADYWIYQGIHRTFPLVQCSQRVRDSVLGGEWPDPEVPDWESRYRKVFDHYYPLIALAMFHDDVSVSGDFEQMFLNAAQSWFVD
ncbi:MAG: hypothetical protein ACRCSF_02255 [Mycobacteriaceae bacterium]